MTHLRKPAIFRKARLGAICPDHSPPVWFNYLTKHRYSGTLPFTPRLRLYRPDSTEENYALLFDKELHRVDPDCITTQRFSLCPIGEKDSPLCVMLGDVLAIVDGHGLVDKAWTYSVSGVNTLYLRPMKL